MKNALLIAATAAALSLAFPAVAADRTTEKVQAALALAYRTEADTRRDANRAPLQALQFMGLRDDMKVFEFGPGAGWYTKILAPVLKDEGELIIGYKKEWIDELADLLAEPELSAVRRVNLDMDWDSELYAFSFNSMDFDAEGLDMFLNIREYHNLHGGDRMAFNRAVFEALKPGGRYVVVDHSRRHMQPDGPENVRREDPVKVLVEVQSAGFDLLDYSDMFYRLDDSLEYEVGRRTVAGNTDRFFFVFTKPE
ncbi:methyltransferase [Pseudohaliea sp.]|uniref:class I SAM-dependent methyltransferase n=1 Tax=Pseudohaliea sp. TaxID=2740289 RepID=UPI0032EAF918